MSHPNFFGSYEADLLQRFMPLAAIAIQNSQRTVTLETKMIEAEKKHAIANLVRGVSHDVNNALGSTLPLVQQIMADAESNRLEMDLLFQDLQQVEQSIQTCRRIFGGMLALARGATYGPAQANVRRALDSTLSILKDGFDRQGIKLDLQLTDASPNIRMNQGDLEQLFLNFATNARDAMSKAARFRFEPKGSTINYKSLFATPVAEFRWSTCPPLRSRSLRRNPAAMDWDCRSAGPSSGMSAAK